MITQVYSEIFTEQTNRVTPHVQRILPDNPDGDVVNILALGTEAILAEVGDALSAETRRTLVAQIWTVYFMGYLRAETKGNIFARMVAEDMA